MLFLRYRTYVNNLALITLKIFDEKAMQCLIYIFNFVKTRLFCFQYDFNCKDIRKYDFMILNLAF